MGISNRLKATAGPRAKHRRAVNNPLSGIHGTSVLSPSLPPIDSARVDEALPRERNADDDVISGERTASAVSLGGRIAESRVHIWE